MNALHDRGYFDGKAEGLAHVLLGGGESCDVAVDDIHIVPADLALVTFLSAGDTHMRRGSQVTGSMEVREHFVQCDARETRSRETYNSASSYSFR